MIDEVALAIGRMDATQGVIVLRSTEKDHQAIVFNDNTGGSWIVEVTRFMNVGELS